MPPKTRTVAFPVPPSAMCRRQSLCSHYGLGPDFDTGGNYPGFDVAPERDEQLACQGHNGDPSRAPSQSTDALAEPFCQLATGFLNFSQSRERRGDAIAVSDLIKVRFASLC